jgi:polysaccharide pyruvyl transferase WcaK-like protein
MTATAPGFRHLPDPILIVGGYGYRNVGDEAILASLLRTLDGRRVTVVSRLPAETAALHDVRAVPLGAAIGQLARHRTLLIGGGGLFGRDMGAVGRLLPAYGLAASALGLTVAIHGVGIDRGLPMATARPLRRFARRAREVSVRDATSAQVLDGWGVVAAVGPDLSAWLPPARPAAGTTFLRANGLDPRRPIVALALAAVNADLVNDVLDASVASIDALPHVQFCFVPMSQHPFVGRHNDLLLARRLQARAPRLTVLESIPHPSVLIAAFSQFSAVVGMRYHSLVFAARFGVPIAPIVYADKCRTWLAERGEVGVEPDAEVLVEHLARALEAPRTPRARRVAS